MNNLDYYNTAMYPHNSHLDGRKTSGSLNISLEPPDVMLDGQQDPKNVSIIMC